MPTTKETQGVMAAFNRIQASADEPSAAGDLALIFNYMKMLDPGSVVREGEFANAQNAGGVSDRMRATYNKILKGERLSTNQRADFLKRSFKLRDAQLKTQNVVNKQYEKLAMERGVDPRKVVINFDDPNDPAVQQYLVQQEAEKQRKQSFGEIMGAPQAEAATTSQEERQMYLSDERARKLELDRLRRKAQELRNRKLAMPPAGGGRF